MAFCSPFAQLAASPLAAAAAFHAACPAVPHDAGSDSDVCGELNTFAAAGCCTRTPASQHVLTCASMPPRAGSYCLAGSLSGCKAAKALGRVSCGAACAGYDSSCSADSSTGGHLPQHMSLPPFKDLDALLAAASCKPGHTRASLDLSTARATSAQLAGEPCMEEEGPAGQQPAAHVRGVLEAYGTRRVADGAAGGIADAALGLIAEHGLADTFYIYDLGEVARLYDTWVNTMPRVMPFYAVKCNPEPSMVQMLAALGAGFDCASIQELQLAAAHGVSKDRIIFANPCKRPADFRYATQHGVAMTTFDCASELEKIAAGYPSFKCVLRIRCDDASAKINLGLKYGADLVDVPMLLGMAKDLGLQVVGVSFHVGSGCQNVGVYADAIAAAREAFDLATAYGFTMKLLDIGGGFTAPYDEPSARLFYTTAATINTALDQHFPAGCGVRVIAEPGRYFAETSATLFTTILGQREGVDALGGPFRDYWLSDGTYGSFRIQVAVDGLEPTYSVLRSPLLPSVVDNDGPEGDGPVMLPCRLWGNSDRDGDVVHKAALLPALRDGDWLMFPFAGAYTICAASNYGGVRFTEPLKLFIYSEAVHRDTQGFDLAAGQAAAEAVWQAAHHNTVARSTCGSCDDLTCGSCAVGGAHSTSMDSASSGEAVGAASHVEEGSGDGGSEHTVGSTEDGVACLLCGGAAACAGPAVEVTVTGSEGKMQGCGGCVCGGLAGVDDGCMSVASEGTAAAGVAALEGCGDSQAGGEVVSMMVVA